MMHTLRRSGGFTVVIAGVFSMVLASWTAAQEHRSDAVDAKARLNSTTVQRVMKGQADFQTEKQKFDDFFQKYYFPAMTSTQPEDLAELGELRTDLFDLYLRATTNEQLQDYLTDMAYKAMVPIVVSKGDPPYHLAARYNALIIIGLLDDQYGIDSGANQRPPKPLPAATDLLVAVLDAGNKDLPVPPALIVGALVGLERHARFSQSLPADKVSKLTKSVLQMATREEPIEGVNREVFRWIQFQSARTLARLGTVGPESKIHEALMNLVADTDLGVDNRCAVASLVGNIKYDGATVDGEKTAQRMFSLARDLSTDEKKRAEEFENLRVGIVLGAPQSAYGGMREAGGFGGYGAGGYGEPIEFERRHVLARTSDLRTGLRAIHPVVPAEAQTKIDAILPAIDAVFNAAADEDTLDLTVTETVHAMTNKIDEVIPPPAEEVGEEALLDESLLEEAPAAEDSAAEAADAASATDEARLPPAADAPPEQPADAPAAAPPAESPAPAQ